MHGRGFQASRISVQAAAPGNLGSVGFWSPFPSNGASRNLDVVAMVWVFLDAGRVYPDSCTFPSILMK